jgi:hypothetical protein
MNDTDIPTEGGAAVSISVHQADPTDNATTKNAFIDTIVARQSKGDATTNTRAPKGPGLQFPFKLVEILKMAEETGQEHIISWLPEGRGFKVHNKEAFCEHIMPLYFSSNKFKTFQRSLNLWGFESVSKGPCRGACYHECFIKGYPEL